ncbi:T7SS effector LXG polymorphic toxin [Oceanobacillus sp. 1P07AA]|uniref:T7SS effector LXG polymorphic toxin n=1 Tax=Oceanobacillus sp. 1P07AA TaxID=3132293 RepID=UPI0039A5FFA9
MGHKVDISEVIEFSDDVKSSTADIKTSLNSISESFDRLNSLESFSGKTATNAKNYFNDLHKTILITFEHLFTDLDDSLRKHLELFKSRVDTSESAIIVSDYVKDLELDIKEDWEKLNLEQDTVRETIKSVSDITSAIHPNYYPPEADKDDVINIITNLEEELNSFTSVGKEEISSIEDLLNQVATAIENAGTVEGEGRFTDYIGSSTTVGLSYLKDYNAEKREIMLDEARKAKDSALKDMDESSQEILNKAYTDLKNGEIEESEYYSYMNELKKLQNEEDMDEEVSENFIKYVIDNFEVFEENFNFNGIAGYIDQSIKDVGKNNLTRSELVKHMNANKPSSTSILLKNQGDKMFKIGKAVSRSLLGVSIAIGTYSDLKQTDKTAGEAIAKNTFSSGAGFLTGALIAGGAKVFLASNPVGWALVGTIVGGTVVTTLANWAYDNNFLNIQDGVDWAGQKLDWAGEQLSNGYNWVDEQVNKSIEWAGDQVNKIGDAFSSGLDFINPFS